MPQSEALQAFLTATPPKPVRMAAARGVLPLPPDELITLLVHLLEDKEPDVAEAAGRTLVEWPEQELVALVQSHECSRSVLAHLSSTTGSDAVREAIILNPAAPPEAIVRLAEAAPAPLLEVILYNRVRLIENPAIVAAVKHNTRATTEIQRLVHEIETEFFASGKSEYRVGREEEAAEEEPVAVLHPLAGLEEVTAEDLTLEGLPVDPDAREGAILERLAKMSVAQKVRAALLGDREMRTILIHSVNKEVASGVLKNPRVTDTEVEGFASMRNVSEEVLRQISATRQWMARYSVAHNLAKNPKTPTNISQRLLSRLQTKDLQLLMRDRGISDVLRRDAKRILGKRNPAQAR